MGFFSNFVGTEFKHASFATEPNSAAKVPVASPYDSQTKIDRLNRRKLEEYQIKDGQTLNTIDIYVSIPEQAGFIIEAVNKTAQKSWDTFFENIGQYGMQLGKREIMARVLSDCPLYGYSYLELVFDKGVIGNRVVDLKPIDAKLMDYARNEQGSIMVDAFQRPIGYTLKTGFSAYGPQGGDVPPEGVQLSQQMFLKAERIACILFRPIGNGFESIGVVETAALDIDRKMKIKEAVANTIHNSAAYPVYAIVGDAQRSASKQLMDSTLTALQNFSSNRFGVFSYPTQLNTLKVEHSPQAEDQLRFLRSEQSTAGGIALGIAVGSGEAVNRQTLDRQMNLLDMKFDGWIARLEEQFNKKVLDKVYQYNKMSSKAKLIWNDVCLDDKIEKAKMMLEGIAAGVISPEEARKYMLTAYDIAPDEEAYKAFKKEKAKAAKQATQTQAKLKKGIDQENDQSDEN
jgi:hypothetical protein